MKVYEYLIIIWFWPLSVLGAIATQELFTESRELFIKSAIKAIDNRAGSDVGHPILMFSAL